MKTQSKYDTPRMQRSKGILRILKFSRKSDILFLDEVLGEAVGISSDPMVWIIIVEFWTNLLHTIDYLLYHGEGGREAELKSNISQLLPLKKIRGLTVSSYWLAAEFPLF